MSGHTTELWEYTVRVRATRARPGTRMATPQASWAQSWAFFSRATVLGASCSIKGSTLCFVKFRRHLYSPAAACAPPGCRGARWGRWRRRWTDRNPGSSSLHSQYMYMTGLQHEGIFHQTCHLWKLALGLYDVQLSLDFNMSETLTQRVNCPKELAIYGPGPDLWPFRFWP